MDKFTTLTGIAAPLPMQNIDTDKVIPARFLKTIKRTGLGVHLFDSMRYNKDGSENPDFVLNREPFRKAEILIAHESFCDVDKPHVEGFRLGNWSGNNERCTGFVDKNGVYFIDDGKVKPTLRARALAQFVRLVFEIVA